MRSEWVFRSLTKRWLGDGSARRAGRRPKRRPAAARPLSLRVEELEARTVPSVLPAPLTTGHLDVSLTGSPQGGNENTPSIAYDPLNPQQLVAVWGTEFVNGAGTTVSEVQMAFSTD